MELKLTMIRIELVSDKEAPAMCHEISQYLITRLDQPVC